MKFLCKRYAVCAAVASATIALFNSPFVSAATVGAVSFTQETSGFADGNSRMIGWQFTVGANPIEVAALGFQDFGQDGLQSAHEVGIWTLSNQSLVADAIVPSGTVAPLDGFFRYVTLGTDVQLVANTTYVIAAFDNGTDAHVWDAPLPGFPGDNVGGFSVNPAITIGPPGTARGPFAATFEFPQTTTSDTRAALMGPNFSIAAVPEPSSAALAILGAFGGVAIRRVVRRVRNSPD